MAEKRPSPDAASWARIAAERRRQAALFQRSYRDRALALLPHVCAACGREFAGRRLPELTVHHKDGNYKNNPPDGSNWELLCLYCHDYEHERHDAADHGTAMPDEAQTAPSIFSPFEKLDTLLAAAGDQADPGTPAAPDPIPNDPNPPPADSPRPGADDRLSGRAAGRPPTAP